MPSFLEFLLLITCTFAKHTQYNIDDEAFASFVAKYGQTDKTPLNTSPVHSIIGILRALQNYAAASNTELPTASEYPYFRWMPFWGNASIPTNGSNSGNKVPFDPLHCFQSGTIHTEYDPANDSQIIINLELFNKTSAGCRCGLLFGTVSRLILTEFMDPGLHRIAFPMKYINVPIAEQWDVETKGIRVFTFLGDLSQTLADAVETSNLFDCLETRDVSAECAKKSVKFLQDYANIDMPPRDTQYEVWQNINSSLIQSGDFLGVIRLDGLDPVLAWAMGAHTGHTTVALRDPKDDTLYIAESTNNGSYWPTNGIQRTEFHEWMTNAHLAGYNVVWEPLADEVRAKFNVTAALQFFDSVEGLNYGYQTMITTWIDTEEDNYPCLPPDFKMCLTWNVLEVGLGLFERWIPNFAAMMNPPLNMRLNVSNYNLSQIYYQAGLDGIASVDLMRMVEQDSYRYKMVMNNGTVVDGLSMVCSNFVCHTWKAGGLFDDIGSDTINCNEFANLDDYGLTFFNANFPSERPEICKQADPNNPLCQLMGDYSLVLENWNTIVPHSHMAETCPSQPPDYNRPANC